MCSGENCWCPSRVASDCADWMKPRARSVYFSIFIRISLSLPLSPEGTVTASSLGFRAAASTFLNQPAVGSADGRAGLAANVGRGLSKRKRRLHKFVCGGASVRNLLRNLMSMTPPAKITGLYRYPVKGLSPEPLTKVGLGVGEMLPADRRYAIENGPSGFDPAAPAWLPKAHFLMLMRDEWLAALHTHFEDANHTLTIRHNGEILAEGDLETAEGRAAIERFFAAAYAGEIKGPPKVLTGPGHRFSDVARKVVSIINLGSLQAIENMVGQPVHPLRFRANLYVEGWPAWHELELLGQTLAIGDTRLKVVKRITRCAAINVDPETAARDLAIPQALQRRLGHADCGIYAEVMRGGEIAVGDAIAVEQPELL